MYDKYVTQRKNGKKPWSLSGLKKVVKQLLTGQDKRKKGSSAKSSVLAPSLVSEAKVFVDRAPTRKPEPRLCQPTPSEAPGGEEFAESGQNEFVGQKKERELFFSLSC